MYHYINIWTSQVLFGALNLLHGMTGMKKASVLYVSKAMPYFSIMYHSLSFDIAELVFGVFISTPALPQAV